MQAPPHSFEPSTATLTLAEMAAQLPPLPGVYRFMGEGALPLYIGKSVNLRARVQSHLRNPQESRWVKRSLRIEHITTAGEIGALLLEAQLIKAEQPLMNQRLRRNRQLCALRLREGSVPEVLSAADVDFACTPNLHGPFVNPHGATRLLHDLADAHGLCLQAMGLEPRIQGRACFRSALGKCSGVCRGAESRSTHDARLARALADWQLRCWPHPGAIAIVEERPGARDLLVVLNWHYLGRADNMAAARKLSQVAAGFDADGYKVLCRPLLRGDAHIEAL